jgi:hypothetical protein
MAKPTDSDPATELLRSTLTNLVTEMVEAKCEAD